MPDHDSTPSAPETTADPQWDARPAITLLAVIVACYVGTIGVILVQVL
jgi:hypothetical protein